MRFRCRDSEEREMEYQMARLGLSDSSHMPGIPGFTPDFGRSLKPFFSESLRRKKQETKFSAEHSAVAQRVGEVNESLSR